MVILFVIVAVGLAVAGVMLVRGQAAARRRELDDSKAEARRWVERLGGQIVQLTGTDPASRQALADASERLNAAGSQLELASTTQQAQLATQTALEGLYYIRAARIAMGLDPGPALPGDAERQQAGMVTEHRKVDVDGHTYEVSPGPGASTPHYHPGGEVDGRQVPQGWYSQPWWKPALIGGAAGLGSALVFGSLFAGMPGIPDIGSWESGFEAGQQEAFESIGYAGFDDEFDL
ncbi:hypothetical protein JOF56_006977 [Kibdelosporangium banguiense]|uniref:DUF1542 domain-containing protein n=1 Tax=Kibdelosporangium banguiense TaxID=1365924 RepID=A0ABS4TQA6_9PSEU|nr:hypothetical protein [Kibdelosporangium banguiense]MBP2326592.1 hypothetical protein [Kibdelosporangium banguiense]